ncbi:hypothetical protein ACFOTA_18145 [Chitinophaga sp. GCM10012297]|uniref:CHAP domain-containing protein n=1 Tax=Chitinophaga chungangae TaxID=2821488 RepID=A0ABS3YHH3_9BACT|nr:hypothetical protein [Chitinophaga chungangae]MBO9154142.1 hypothetical protein [Chitinophaga chungangae]
MLRPTVTNDDNYLSKIIKYIPAEVIAVYTAAAGILKPVGGEAINLSAYKVTVIIILVLTPIWTYFAVIDKPTSLPEEPKPVKRAVFHAIIATISFIVWLFAIGDMLFIAWWCEIKQIKCLYDAKVASLVLILYTGLIVPLLERIVLGKPVPPKPYKRSLIDPTAQKIIDTCGDKFEDHKSDCSGFATAVAKEFGIIFAGNADSIVTQIQGAGWTKLDNGVAAKGKADAGWFVVAGLKSSDHTPPRNNGHVAIVVSGGLAHGKYPTGSWGTLGGEGSLNKTLNYAWNTNDRDNVLYYCRQVP